MFEIQQQIKQNSTDISKYVQELYDWEDEMHTKQPEQKKKVQQAEQKQKSQAIKNKEKEEKKKVKEESKNENLIRDKTNIADYYKAWDNFDPDKEIEEIDKQEQYQINQKTIDARKMYTTSSKVRSKAQIVVKGGRKYQTDVRSLKDKGNLQYKSCEFQQAADTFTECLNKYEQEKLEENELKVILYSNRAMTYLKLQQYSNALADCEAGLIIQPNNNKLWYRKGLALKKLGQWKFAKQSLEQAGESEEVKKEIKMLEQKIEARRKEVVKALKKEQREFEDESIALQVVEVKSQM